ncbi:MAG: UvrD-helicase domain-containing protein [Motilibacteraceae bacterium]
MTGWAGGGRRHGRWRLEELEDRFRLTVGDATHEFVGADVARLRVAGGWLRASVQVQGLEPSRLKGLRKAEAGVLRSALEAAVLRAAARPALEAALRWRAEVQRTAEAARAQGRWITTETTRALLATRPGPDVVETVERAAARQAGPRTTDEVTAARFLLADLPAWIAARNEEIFQQVRTEHAAFFERVESRPLTEEQARAVITYDNRVHVIAAAGSGKTSVMVARAAYAVMRGLVAPDRVLLLAFNKAAAEELGRRVEARFTALGLPTQGIRATTFHAFGLSTIAAATGRKPRPAPWLDSGQDVERVCRIVDELRDTSPGFAYRWDLFRLVYARAGESATDGEPDGWDPKARAPGFRTANGEVVKSQGERMIADFLFYNGVAYEYERAYVHDTADVEHSQYRPDFYYPQADLWHEHWALDADGAPPPEFHGYADGMRWKRGVHARYRTSLVETTWAQIMSPSGLDDLGRALQDRGIALDWDPDRAVAAGKPLEHEDLARLIRAFMTHVKSNSLSREELEARVGRRTPAAARPRARLFLELYAAVAQVWDEQLRREGFVDFEDMLVDAAGHLEAGRAARSFDLVMVDEFQDVSQARARLVKALVGEPGKHLLAVGDDWQSINRFAGADLSVMTRFAEWFGDGPTLRLQTTFRCPQTLCDTASAFVAKNPRQLRKVVRSAQVRPGPQVRLVRVAQREQLRQAVGAELSRIAAAARSEPSGGTRVSVDVLGRYGFDRDLVPASRHPGLQLTFRTAHGSKGLEADYVLLPNVTDGVHGFPSGIQDDPVLGLAMVDPDPHPHAEERRLFYVALTRARREVTLLTVVGHESPFVVELLEDGLLDVGSAEAGPAPEVCPTCRKGVLVQRNGKYGPFVGCSTFPRCGFTRKIGGTPSRGSSGRYSPNPF